jgi:hypothetical protein
VYRAPAVFALTLACLALAACGGGSDSTPTPTPDFATVAPTIVPRVPLTIDDMPGGWEQNAEGDTGLTQDVDLPAECNIFDLHVAFPNAFTTSTGPQFHDGSKQVTSYGAIYQTADAAQKDVDATHDILDRCSDDYKSAVEKVADDQLSALGIHLGFLASIDVTLQEQPQSTGDGSRFYQLQAKVSIPGDDLTFTLEARVFRVGRTVAAVTYYTSGNGGTDEERDITAKLLESATEADGALPD